MSGVSCSCCYPLQACSAYIGKFSSAAQTGRTVFLGIGLPAQRASGNRFHVTPSQECVGHLNGCRGADGIPGGLDFRKEPALVLVLLFNKLEEPSPDHRPSVQLVHIQISPEAQVSKLVEEAEGESAQVHELEPLIAHAALGQKLYRIRQALGGLNDHFK